MRSVSIINNVKANKWGLNIQEAYLFSWIYELPSWADRIIIKSDVFYFCSKGKIVSELPLISDKPDTIYRYLKSLSSKNLVLIKKIDGKDYVSITDLGKTWNDSGQSEYSEKNPNELGKFSELNSDLNPTYNNIYSITIIDNITKDNFADFLKKSEKALNSSLKECFLAKYKKEMNTDFYFTAKESGKLKPIIQKIVFKMKEKSNRENFLFEEIYAAIKFFIESSWSVLSNYEKSKFSLTLIDSNFNDIFVKIKSKSNGEQINTTNQRSTDFRYSVPDPRA